MDNKAVAMGDSGLLKQIVKLAFLIPVLLVAACDSGEGPRPIAGTPAPPPPPAGVCDANITFEPECGVPRGEVPAPFNFNGGATDIVLNPVKSGINVSERVAKMRKFPEQVFGGTKFLWPGGRPNGPIDFSNGEFFLMKVWSSRPVPVSFKLEDENFAAGGFTQVVNHTGGSEWQLLCFDMTGQAVPPPVLNVTVIFDDGVLGQAGSDPDNWTFYYDDIKQVRSCDTTPPAGTPIDPDATLFSSSGAPTLVIPDDYAEITPFGSGSVIDQMYADDPSFSPVLSVWSGSGYGANVAQVGFIGFQAGFLNAYGSVDFKVKGMPNQVIFVKLFDGVDTLRINLTASAFSEALAEEGWFQVSIPIDRFSNARSATGIVFESDNTSIDQFRMLLTDIGFSGTGTPPFDGGLITNGGFELGTSPWLAGTDNAIAPGDLVDDPINAGNTVYFANVTAANPDQPFLVNLSQRGLDLTQDETYRLSFKARSNVNRTILAGIGLSGAPFTNVNQAVSLTTDWQTFEIDLTANFSNADSRVLFDLNGENGEVYIDDVRLIVAPETTPPFDGGLVTNGDFEAGTSPWLAGTDNAIADGDLVDDPINAGNTVYFANVTAANPDQPFLVNLSQRGLDLTQDETYRLTFKARSNVNRTIVAGIGLSGAPFTNVNQAVSLTTDWQTFEIDLTANFSNADSRVLFDLNGENGEVYIDDVRLIVAPAGGGGDLVNGDFETGDLSGWTVVLGPPGIGTAVAETPGPAGRAGTVARLNAAGQGATGNDVLIVQGPIGAGTIQAGDTIDVSFDLYGSVAGPGGVVFVEVIFLDGSGNDNGRDFLNSDPTPYFPNDTWTTYSGSVTAGTTAGGGTADVSGGITLSLKAACGADVSCATEGFFDNVTLTIN